MDVKEIAKKALAGKGQRYKPHEIHIQRTQNKGYLVRHSLADKNGRAPTDGQRAELTYGLANHDELLNHLTAHFGDEPEESDNDKEEGEEDDTEEEERYPEKAGPRAILMRG
jgi:hypothetical protein